jgi:MFS family permease
LVKRVVSSLAGIRKPRFFYGYVVVGAGIIIQLIIIGMGSTYGVFFNPLLEEFEWTRAVLSGASALSLLLMGFLAIVAGGLTDRFGPRVVMSVCGLLFSLGFLLMSRINDVWQLYLVYGVLVAFGSGAVDVIPLSITARWFVKKRGFMSGVVKVGTGLGMFIMPLVAGGLIGAYEWRTAYVILGVIAIVVVIPFSQLLRRGPEPTPPAGGEEPAGAGGSRVVREEGLSLREAARTRQFWTLCITYLLIFFYANTIVLHIVPHASDLNFSVASAAGVLSTVGALSVVGRLVMGYVGDRIGNKRAIIICFVIAIATLAWLQFAREVWSLYLFAVIYGFAHGGFFAILSPIVAGLFGTYSQGANLGVVIFSGTIGGSIGPVLAGHVFDVTHSYRLVFIILLVLAVIGLLLIMSLKPVGGEGGTRV